MTRDECLDRAAQAYADGLADLTALAPADAAAAAYVPGGPSVADLTERITERITERSAA